MTRISVELVPRDPTQLLHDYDIAVDKFVESPLINIPDLTRMSLRSWDAAALLHRAKQAKVIPHIRAIDIAPGAPLPCAQQANVSEILIVEGDPPNDPAQPTWPNASADIIRRYRQEAPHLTVYAAFDPYRRAPYAELEAIKRKEDAGAQGFFTQPIFDTAMLGLCAKWLETRTIFWGVSPVIGEKSRAYWERMNHVVFPNDFEPSLSANIRFAQSVIDFAKLKGDHVYLMPLRVSIADYLGGLKL